MEVDGDYMLICDKIWGCMYKVKDNFLLYVMNIQGYVLFFIIVDWLLNIDIKVCLIGVIDGIIKILIFLFIQI